MKITSSYQVEILSNTDMKNTVQIYRRALAFVIDVCNKEWRNISVLGGTKEKDHYVVTLKGKAAHGSIPEFGINAGVQLIKALGEEDRAPRLVVLENVCGALSSHDGKDFAAICSALSNNGYRFGAVVINAVHFPKCSRPCRLNSSSL